MKIAFFSDLHVQDDQLSKDYIQHWKERMCIWQENNKADALLLVGDIFEADQHGTKDFLDVLRELFEIVIYVPGNHEYYFTSMINPEFKFKKYCYGNIIFCDKPYQIVEYNGYKFHCGTMWYDIGEAYGVRKGISDFQCIGGYSLSSVQDQYDEFMNNLQLVEFKQNDIVVTHHAPRQRKPFNDLDCYYNGNLNQFLIDKSPATWFNGHQHNSWDYKFHNTRILSNALGNFDPFSTVPRLVIL